MPFRQESQAFVPDIYKPHASGKTPSTLACIPRPPCPISCPPCSGRVHGVGPPRLMEIQQPARELDISVRVTLALPADDSEKPRAPNLAVAWCHPKRGSAPRAGDRGGGNPIVAVLHSIELCRIHLYARMKMHNGKSSMRLNRVAHVLRGRPAGMIERAHSKVNSTER